MRAHKSSQASSPATVESVTPQQADILLDLLGGMSVVSAAAKRGVSRSTVHRWMKEDAAFVAALNSARRLYVEEYRDRLLHMFEAALEAVKDGIERGDAKLALALLQRTGVLGIDIDGAPQTADDVAFATEAKGLERRMRLAKLMND